MGQKTHPYGFRVGITRPWLSRWYASKGTFGTLLVEDAKIREHIKERLHYAGIGRTEIERAGDEVRLLLHTARPGIVIGRKGVEIDRLRDELQAMTGKKIMVNIREIENPALDPQIVAEEIAEQLAKRASHRRVMRKALEATRAAGAKGVKIICSGRLGGSEFARKERYVDGALPLHTLQADIRYGFSEARTTYGRLGVKVWVYLGRIEDEANKSKEDRHGPHA